MHGIPSATLATSSGSSMANVSSNVSGRSATSGITGKPLEEAQSELWHSREMQARLARLARPMIDLLPSVPPEPTAAQAQTICHLSRDKRWHLAGNDWQWQRFDGTSQQASTGPEPGLRDDTWQVARHGDGLAADSRLALPGLEQAVKGLMIAGRPLPLAFWTLAAARHRGERHAGLDIAHIGSVREALCWGELIARLRAPDGRPPRVTARLANCTVPVLEASLYFLQPWLERLTLQPHPEMREGCHQVLLERTRLTDTTSRPTTTNDDLAIPR